VVVVAIAQGALVAVWLESRQVASSLATGSLTITSEPAGATVSVDGLRHGVTPSSVSLAPGEHRIDIGEGASMRTRTVQVAAGGAVLVHLEMTPRVAPAPTLPTTGELRINAEPSGAQVVVDGRSYGASPVLVRQLSPGSHTVTVSGPSGRMTQRVTVQPGMMSSLVMSLGGAAEFASGWLAISSPIRVEILERGNILGSTDSPRLLVAAGRHDFELTNVELGYRVRRTVQIVAGQTASLRLDIPNGVLNINALPWAEVWVGSRALGETPIANLPLPLGTHELLFRHPDLGEQRKTVVVGAGAPVRVGVDLRKGPQ
jgi:hypothetical protein